MRSPQLVAVLGRCGPVGSVVPWGDWPQVKAESKGVSDGLDLVGRLRPARPDVGVLQVLEDGGRVAHVLRRARLRACRRRRRHLAALRPVLLDRVDVLQQDDEQAACFFTEGAAKSLGRDVVEPVPIVAVVLEEQAVVVARLRNPEQLLDPRRVCCGPAGMEGDGSAVLRGRIRSQRSLLSES